MLPLTKSQASWALPGLLGLMAATRFHHFGSAISLPDASLAVFFLAGLYLGGYWLLALFLAVAGLADYLAITYGGVSSWCMSPGYIFLIPTYAVMWWAGRWCSRYNWFNRGVLLTSGGTLLLATALAFLISNSGFYLFSGRFLEMDWLEYLIRVAKYYPSYLTSTLCYIGAVLGLHALLNARHALAVREGMPR